MGGPSDGDKVVDEQDNATPAPVALSFGFSASARGARGAAKTGSQRSQVNGSEEGISERQLITGIEGSRLCPAEPTGAPEKRKYIVARLENTYRVGVGGPPKFTPSFRPPANDAPTVGDGADRFEAAVVVPVSEANPALYGLQQRVREPAAAGNGPPDDGSGATAANGASNGNESGHLSQLMKSARMRDDEVLRRDMEALPGEASLEAYEDLPIEHFGRAMLMGMGWVEGQGVGRNRRDVSAIEYVRRPDRLGLGAAPAPAAPVVKKVVKMGDRPARQDLVLAPDADGRQRHVRKLDEALVLRSSVLPGPQPGKVMRVVDGRHEGLEARVLALLPKREGHSDRASVCLVASNATVEVRCKDLQELWEKGAAPAAPPARNGADKDRPAAAAAEAGAPSARERDGGGSKGAATESRRVSGQRQEADDGGVGGSAAGRRRDGGEELGSSGREPESSKRHKGMPPPPPRTGNGAAAAASRPAVQQDPLWLSQYIKVRILDKQARGGRFYLKKGTIVDVHPGRLADVSVDDTSDIVQLPQSLLETVVPKAEGSSLLIVRGELRGQRARLLQARVADGCAAVQLVEDHSLQRLLLDDIAQYMGSMEDE